MHTQFIYQTFPIYFQGFFEKRALTEHHEPYFNFRNLVEEKTDSNDDQEEGIGIEKKRKCHETGEGNEYQENGPLDLGLNIRF